MSWKLYSRRTIPSKETLSVASICRKATQLNWTHRFRRMRSKRQTKWQIDEASCVRSDNSHLQSWIPGELQTLLCSKRVKKWAVIYPIDFFMNKFVLATLNARLRVDSSKPKHTQKPTGKSRYISAYSQKAYIFSNTWATDAMIA